MRLLKVAIQTVLLLAAVTGIVQAASEHDFGKLTTPAYRVPAGRASR